MYLELYRQQNVLIIQIVTENRTRPDFFGEYGDIVFSMNFELLYMNSFSAPFLPETDHSVVRKLTLTAVVEVDNSASQFLDVVEGHSVFSGALCHTFPFPDGSSN